MAKKISLAPCVEQELWEIWSYIAQDNPQAATRVIKAAEKTFNRLADNPGLGRERRFRDPRLQGICTWPLAGFKNYLVFFRRKVGVLEVLHVWHGARDFEALLGGEF